MTQLSHMTVPATGPEGPMVLLDRFVNQLSQLTATFASTVQREAKTSIEISLFRKSGSSQGPVEMDTELRKLIEGLERSLIEISKHKSGMFIRQTR
jgi:hypothetical protein